MDSNGSSRTILLEFKATTQGQTCCNPSSCLKEGGEEKEKESSALSPAGMGGSHMENKQSQDEDSNFRESEVQSFRGACLEQGGTRESRQLSSSWLQLCKLHEDRYSGNEKCIKWIIIPPISLAYLRVKDIAFLRADPSAR